MDNRFLFRGKKLNNDGEMVIGYFMEMEHNDDKSHVHRFICPKPILEYPEQLSIIEIDPATVSQCTGICDKNGKLIFEGDIIFHHHPEEEWRIKGVVKYEVCWGGFYFAGNRGMNTTTTYEILGNIWDNFELIKE